MAECTPDDCKNRKPRGGICDRCYARQKWARLKADPARLEAHRQEHNARRLAQRQADPDRFRAQWRKANRRRLEQNPELTRATRKRTRDAWAAANREKSLQVRRAAWDRWKARHPERAVLIRREVYMRRRKAMGSDPVDYAAILLEHGMTCHLCGDAIPSPSELHFDHVIPLARGGAHAAENIRPAHALCNLRKGARLIP